jgi:hypothetical protein
MQAGWAVTQLCCKVKVWLQPLNNVHVRICAGMQGGWMAATTETYANQYGYFKLAYDYGWGSLSAQTAYGYKGIMFWRWDATGTSAGGFDDAATIGAWPVLAPLDHATSQPCMHGADTGMVFGCYAFKACLAEPLRARHERQMPIHIETCASCMRAHSLTVVAVCMRAETNSGVFRDIIGPYSRAVAGFLANPNRPTVPHCKPLNGAAAAAPAPAPVQAPALAPVQAPTLAPASAPALAATQAAVAPAVAADAAAGAAITAAAPRPAPTAHASNITTGAHTLPHPGTPVKSTENTIHQQNPQLCARPMCDLWLGTCSIKWPG